MTTESRFGVDYTPITVNGKYCGVLRGLWKMVGDMMGGPFVSHAFLDTKALFLLLKQINVTLSAVSKQLYIHFAYRVNLKNRWKKSSTYRKVRNKQT